MSSIGNGVRVPLPCRVPGGHALAKIFPGSRWARRASAGCPRGPRGALWLNVRCAPQGSGEVGRSWVRADDGEKLAFPNERLALNPLFPKMSFLNGLFQL